MRTFWAAPIYLAGFISIASSQSENVLLKPQSNNFNSFYHLSPQQRAAAGIDDVLANNVEIALNFERSNWADGPVTELPFYAAPANASDAAAGSLLKLQLDANASAYTLPPNTAISRILFQTETLNGTAVPASAYILWPYIPRKVADGYPVVSWAHSTSGVFPECGPSHVRNLWYHFMAPYALVQQGYVVVAPDYQGLGVGQDANGDQILHPYLSHPSLANDMVYAVQAARTAFASLSRRFVVVGHSQGGGVAWGVAERQARKPVDGYLGTVAGSPLTDFIAQVDAETNPAYIGALLIAGLQSMFPDFDISSILAPEGVKRFRLAANIQGCNPVFTELLFAQALYQSGWQYLPRVKEYRDINGSGGRKIVGPLLVVQGVADPIVSAEVTDAAVDKTCALYPDASLEYQRYAGATHIPAMYASQRNWLNWIEDRFNGRPVERGCARREYESALPIEQYQKELNWFIEYAVDTYETQ